MVNSPLIRPYLLGGGLALGGTLDSNEIFQGEHQRQVKFSRFVFIIYSIEMIPKRFVKCTFTHTQLYVEGKSMYIKMHTFHT